jgi:hypothetical protein
MPAFRRLDAIASDYERAEITAFWLHDRDLKTHTMLYAVVELCPVEQPRSTEICGEDANGRRVPTRRRNLKEPRALYAARLFVEGPAAGLAFYRGVGDARKLELDSGAIEIRSIRGLAEEPPNEIPVLVAERGEETYQYVLPRRPTDLRVCSRFADGLGYLQGLTSKEKDDYRAFSQEVLGIDLVEYAEHLGAVHVCMANPILRSMSDSLDRDDSNLLVEMYERRGRSVKGCRLRLTDHRPGGIGFDLELEVTSAQMVAPLPHRPQELETRLYSPSHDLLGYRRAAFISGFNIQVGVGHSQRRISTPSADGSVKEELVQVMSWESRHAAEETHKTPIATLRDAIQQRRQRREAEAFFFFPGGSESREKARALIRSLVRAARDRCLLCDPYLSAEDVSEYATFATTYRLPIRLLTSARYLAEGNDDKGTRLQERIRDLVQHDASLIIACRVLQGRAKSPVHDRFLMLDDDVYLIGSSLAELGSRATTVYRSPRGATPNLPGVLEGWWNDSRRTMTLDDWCSRKTGDSEE